MDNKFNIIESKYLKKLKEDDPHRIFFTNTIKSLIKFDLFDENYQHLLNMKIDEIQKYCEFDTIVEALEYVIYNIKELKNKDSHNEHRKETDFYTARDNFVKKLKENYYRIDIKQIENIEYIKDIPTKEEKLQKAKDNLFKFLREDCNTGKKRALNITNILNALKKTIID